MAASSEVVSHVQAFCSSASSPAEQSGARQALAERMLAPAKLSLLEIVSEMTPERALVAPRSH